MEPLWRRNGVETKGDGWRLKIRNICEMIVCHCINYLVPLMSCHNRTAATLLGSNFDLESLILFA